MNQQDEHDLKKIEQLSDQFSAHFIMRPVFHANHHADRRGTTSVSASCGQPIQSQGLMAGFKPNQLDYVLEKAAFIDLHIVAHGIK